MESHKIPWFQNHQAVSHCKYLSYSHCCWFIAYGNHYYITITINHQPVHGWMDIGPGPEAAPSPHHAVWHRHLRQWRQSGTPDAAINGKPAHLGKHRVVSNDVPALRLPGSIMNSKILCIGKWYPFIAGWFISMEKSDFDLGWWLGAGDQMKWVIKWSNFLGIHAISEFVWKCWVYSQL